MPVETGAGISRMRTGTPLCSPTPAASTGRWMVVSNRIPYFTSLGQRVQVFDLQRLVKPTVWLKRYNSGLACSGSGTLGLAFYGAGTAVDRRRERGRDPDGGGHLGGERGAD